MKVIAPPQTLQALQILLDKIEGRTLQELAGTFNLSLPKNQLNAKGWVGQLIERHLGADAYNQACPDFTHLGIELKTLPLNDKLEPKESTFLCSAPNHLSALLETWESSHLYQKLKQIVWVPIEGNHPVFYKRHIGKPFFWTMQGEEEQILRQDWLDLTDLLYLGKIEELTAHQGVYLQVRPKAAHGKILQARYNSSDEMCLQGPKGFYLRASFTKQLLNKSAPYYIGSKL